MKAIRRLLILISALFLISITYADIDFKYVYTIPEYMGAIINPDDLRPYIASDSVEVRIKACVRLGEIKNNSSFELLKEAFEKEPYQAGSEVPNAVRYYSLISIGKINVSQSENYLKEVARKHMKAKYDLNTSGDSIMVIYGALEGLFKINSKSSVAFIDSVFGNENFDWMVRYQAHIFLTKSILKSYEYKSASDTANFLITALSSNIGNDKMWTEAGEINVNFITSGSYKVVLYEYGETLHPYLTDYINGLSLDNPAKPVFERIRNDIISNLPK